MFEVPVDNWLNIFLYTCTGLGILFAIAILSRHVKIAIYIFVLVFYVSLIWVLGMATGSINCVCERQTNNLVACEKTRYIFYGLFKEKQVISPLEGVERRDYSEHTEIHLISRNKRYLLYTGQYYSPFELFPIYNITEDIEGLIAGKGESIRHYKDGGIMILSIVSTLIISFLMLLMAIIFVFWIKPAITDFPW